MRRLLSPGLILSLAACASTPVPAVQNAPPPAPTTTEPAPATTESTDAGPPIAIPSLSPDAGPPEATAPTGEPADPTATTTHPTTTTHPAVAVGGAVAEGRAVFQRVCARCHEDGDADGPTPNKRWAEARMRGLIRNGSARMRAIPMTRLSDADLAQLVSYLRSTHTIR